MGVPVEANMTGDCHQGKGGRGPRAIAAYTLVHGIDPGACEVCAPIGMSSSALPVGQGPVNVMCISSAPVNDPAVPQVLGSESLGVRDVHGSRDVDPTRSTVDRVYPFSWAEGASG